MNSKELTDDLQHNIQRIIKAYNKADNNIINHKWIRISYNSNLTDTLSSLASLLNAINRNIFPEIISDCQFFEKICVGKRDEIESSINDLLQEDFILSNVKSPKTELERLLKEIRDTAHEYEQHLI